MPKKRTTVPDRQRRVVTGIYQAIDFWTAILLLTGQVASSGVFISPGGFWLSMTGPILGGVRITGKSAATTTALDAVDVITALLLISGQLTMTGPWISSGSFNLVVSGPAFGVYTVPVPANQSEIARNFFGEFRRMALSKFAMTDEENPDSRKE